MTLSGASMGSEVMLRRALHGVDSVVDGATGRAWSRPSPCPDWNARAVLGHLIDVSAQIAGLMRNQPASPCTEVAALEELVGQRPASAWASAHAQVLEALADACSSTIQTARGPIAHEQVLLMVTVEPLIHGWDLARALERRDELDPAVVEAVLPGVLAARQELPATGMYAPPVPIPAHAPPRDQLLAALGRTP